VGNRKEKRSPIDEEGKTKVLETEAKVKVKNLEHAVFQNTAPEAAADAEMIRKMNAADAPRATGEPEAAEAPAETGNLLDGGIRTPASGAIEEMGAWAGTEGAADRADREAQMMGEYLHPSHPNELDESDKDKETKTHTMGGRVWTSSTIWPLVLRVVVKISESVAIETM
jgi:hypothetical protein